MWRVRWQSFVLAMQLKDGKTTTTKEASARGNRRKENTNDTWCEHHRMWYPASENHAWDGLKGSCQAAKTTPAAASKK